MAYDVKGATPDTSLPTDGFLIGADSQSATDPSIYSTQTVATTLLGSTSLTTKTETTSKPLIDHAQTWNAGAETFTGWKLNVTDTASAAASLLMDLQVGGTYKLKVTKAGNLSIAGSLTVVDAGASIGGGLRDGVDSVSMGWNSGVVGIVSTGNLQWTSGSSSSNNSGDIRLYRDAAGVLGVRATSSTTGAALSFVEQTAPSAPSTNGVRIYAEDNGAGKTRLMALFATGAAQQIAIEP
jgi:hypothetical protein